MSQNFFERSQPFLAFLDKWNAGLPVVQMTDIIKDPDRTAVISVDVTNGFCNFGPLASPRVAAIIDPIVRIFESAWNLGVRSILLSQDTHEPDAREFAAWPSHCVRGTSEAETVAQIKALPFFDKIDLLEKNSISTGLNPGMDNWMAAHNHVDTFIVVGDCTDLCVYQLAMHLLLDANSRQLERRVVVPAQAVDTYDYPVESAEKYGGLPHDAELHHAFFLYHMALNGVQVVKGIE